MNMWLSKDDVKRDLAECNGHCTNVDDDYIARGSRPPPPAKINEDNDDEIISRFGGYGDQLANSDIPEPDLEGITKMLRWVNTFDKPQDGPLPKAMGPPPRHKTSPQKTETIVISKLNPNVQEFVPKSLKTESNTVKEELDQALADHQKKNSIINKVENGTAEDNSHKIKDNVASATITSQLACNKIVNGVGLCSSVDFLRNKEDSANTNDAIQEKQKIEAFLKSKISAPSKEDSYEKKTERNVALATLLRLHTVPATPSPQPIIEPPKPPPILLTPDYFTAGPSRAPKELIVDDTEHAIPEPTPLLETAKTPSPRETNDPYIKESIEKVKNWLNSPDSEKKAKAKAPVPYIGRVTFKKKESISPGSPCSEVSKKAEPVYKIPAFVPSQRATEHARDMQARVKAQEDQEKVRQSPQDLWTKLETELKARDEAIRNRSRDNLDEDSRTSSAKNSRSSSRQVL